MAANVYPTLAISIGSGAVVQVVSQYPYEEQDIYSVQQSTVAAGFSVGRPYNTTFPLKRFVLTYTQITRADLTVLENFFISMRGRLGQFTFTDDAGNLWTNCRYDMDEFDSVYTQYNQYGTATIKLYATLNSFVPFDPNLGDEGSDSGPTPQTQET